MTRHLLLAGSYGPADQPAIYAFDFDDGSGALAAAGAFAGVADPSFLALHPAGRQLYAVSEATDGGPGAVWAFALGRGPARLEPLGSQPSRGELPCHLLVDPGGRWLAVTNYGSGSVAVLPIRPDGALGAPVAAAQHAGRGPNPARQEGPHAHASILDRAGRHLIVADLGIDQLLVYRLDGAAGALQAHGQTPTRPGAGPRHLAFHPGGQLLYVANELDSTVTLYAYDPAGGALDPLQTLSTLPGWAGENSVADIHLAPGAARLYVSNRGHNSLAVFGVGGDGRLELLATAGCGGDWPRNFALAPGGRFVVVANQHSGELVVLPLQPGGEEVGAPVARAALPGAACVLFVP